MSKSTLARLLAREFAVIGWNVKIADMDISQGTSFNWASRRLQNRIHPEIPVQQYGSVSKALAEAENLDLLVFDGAPHSTAGTKEIAKASDMVVIPTGLTLDDLEPAVLLAHELVKSGVQRKKIVLTLTRTGESASELQEARDYLDQTPYFVLGADLPEKTAYRKASDKGLALSETSFPTLRERAAKVAQELVDRVENIS